MIYNHNPVATHPNQAMMMEALSRTTSSSRARTW